ncbi:hypothetical protein M422DRAFT_248205 [Sphaerobolus stellatus SS14]|uniref:BTB domain-containing protein n=1 Tax=Sphaerobolus stellatus (strain SS14) TaxID=990650 RepID=A0A0C9UWL1_SPHS4|nr:hypothetical protein M422DRAFT_248205 [Sphaerobolus stellatus SS14]
MAPKRARSQELESPSISSSNKFDDILIPGVKRIHKDTDSSGELAFEKSLICYLSNRMITLLVEDTGFRVSSELLPRRSEVFATMLSLHQAEPEATDDHSKDRSLVVRLQGNKADWEAFLDVFYGERIFRHMLQDPGDVGLFSNIPTDLNVGNVNL